MAHSGPSKVQVKGVSTHLRDEEAACHAVVEQNEKGTTPCENRRFISTSLSIVFYGLISTYQATRCLFSLSRGRSQLQSNQKGWSDLEHHDVKTKKMSVSRFLRVMRESIGSSHKSQGGTPLPPPRNKKDPKRSFSLVGG